jgi:hypothetical protein
MQATRARWEKTTRSRRRPPAAAEAEKPGLERVVVYVSDVDNMFITY